MRTQQIFTTSSTTKFKKQLLNWAQKFEEIVLLDSNDYHQQYGDFDAILAVDAFTLIKTDFVNAFEKLNEYQQQTKDWLFGYLTYDLKNDTENLISQNNDGLNFADLIFFQPQKIITIKGDQICFHYLKMVDDEITSDFETINKLFLKPFEKASTHKIKINAKLNKDQYKQRVAKMQQYISKGDIYEANFCQEFFVENTVINPLATYCALNDISSSPFATFFRFEEQYALCASPERYLKKEGDKLISQPIKGTAKRVIDLKEDSNLALSLSTNEKERAENIMIVDLVRNDLSKTAQKGSVKIEELCKVYSFKQVHQMISTITSKAHNLYNPVDILKTTFPMGSMTGAPKVSAMQIIENLEVSKRGLYSGAIGYFTPNGDFDFNVVIRTILYNQSTNYTSFSVGSAITAKSNIDSEYEECLLKAKAMRQVLEQ